MNEDKSSGQVQRRLNVMSSHEEAGSQEVQEQLGEINCNLCVCKPQGRPMAEPYVWLKAVV